MRVVATYNIKGGVGKTTAAVNLGYLAARDGLRTLIWDLDPQGSATYLFRVKPKVKGGGKALVAGRRTLDVVGVELAPVRFERRPREDQPDDAEPERRHARPVVVGDRQRGLELRVGLVVVAERDHVDAPQQHLTPLAVQEPGPALGGDRDVGEQRGACSVRRPSSRRWSS